MAQNNIYAAYELGEVYYFGEKFFIDNESVFVISKDYKKAEEFYLKAALCDPPLGQAAWSIGYMLINKSYRDISIEEAEEWGEMYFTRAKQTGFIAAEHCLAGIKLNKARRLFEESLTITDEIYRLYQSANCLTQLIMVMYILGINSEPFTEMTVYLGKSKKVLLNQIHALILLHMN